MGYQEDLDHAAAEMKTATQELREAEVRVMTLQKRMAALAALLALDKPEAARTVEENWLQSEEAQMWMSAPPRIADQIRRILAATGEVLTVKEIRDELRAVGMDLSKQANPAATIGSVCARLVEQEFAEELHKGGRKAWKKK